MPHLPAPISPQQNHPLYRTPLPTSPKPATPPRPPPTELSIAPITAPTLPAYRRLITLLLPIRYPDQFYKDSIANPRPSSLALCALWRETPRVGKRKVESLNGNSGGSSFCLAATEGMEDVVIGGIQCRLEPLPGVPAGVSSSVGSAGAPQQQQQQQQQQPHNLYIQTLAVLAPYRSLGIATALLDAVVSTALTHYACRDVNVKEIYAHVWEANEEALEWYVKRGFEVGEEVVEGYYRKLRPSGARVVRRKVGVGDWVGVAGGWEGKREEMAGAQGEIERGGDM